MSDRTDPARTGLQNENALLRRRLAVLCIRDARVIGIEIDDTARDYRSDGGAGH